MTERHDIEDEAREPEKLRRMLADLRSLPTVSAPLDFEHHLREKLAVEASKKKLSWWRRFLPGLSGPSWRIPAFAYGATATVVIVTFSLYLSNITGIDETLQEGRLNRTEGVPTELQEDVVEPPDQPAVDKADSDVLQEPPQNSPSRARQQIQKNASENTLGTAATKSLEHDRTDKKKAESAPAPARRQEESLEKEAQMYAPVTRGLFDAALAGRPDSAAIADSLRTLDSLRHVRERKVHDPPRDATQ